MKFKIRKSIYPELHVNPLHLPTGMGMPSAVSYELCFCTSYLIYMFFFLMGRSFYPIPDMLLKLVVVLCGGVAVVGELLSYKHSFKETFFLLLCLFLAEMMNLRMGFTMLLHFLMIYCGRKISVRKIASMTVGISCFCMLFTIASAFAGIIPNYVAEFVQHGELRRREYVGFRFALYPSMILYNIISMDLYIHRKDLTIRRCIFWAICCYIMYHWTSSRLSFFLAIFVIAAFMILRKWPNFLKYMPITQGLMLFSFILCPAFSFWMTLHYSNMNKFMRELNEILEKRLELGYNAFQQYEINLFGQDIVYIGNGLNAEGKSPVGIYNYVDCFYENVLLRYGMLFFVLVILFFTSCVFIAWRKKDYHMMGLLAVLAVHGMIDDLVLQIYNNTLWFVIGSYLFTSADPDPKPVGEVVHDFLHPFFRRREIRITGKKKIRSEYSGIRFKL